MSYKSKSDIYLDAAKELDTKSFYPAVPHTAYYSCFLLMEYICYEKNGDTPHSSIPSGIHVRMINYIKGQLLLKNQYALIREFSMKIDQLKRLRIEADYKKSDIMSNQSNNSIRLADEVLHILKTLV
jgi:uncharacterized protein (UPF0332 family)